MSVCAKAEELCEQAFNELATQSLDCCLTSDGCDAAVSTLETYRSQVLSIPDEKMASMAKEMPETSSLVQSIEKMVHRKDQVAHLLQARADSINHLAMSYSVMRDQLETVSDILKPCIVCAT